MEKRTNNLKKAWKNGQKHLILAWKNGQKHLILPWKNGQAHDNTKNKLVH